MKTIYPAELHDTHGQSDRSAITVRLKTQENAQIIEERVTATSREYIEWGPSRNAGGAHDLE